MDLTFRFFFGVWLGLSLVSSPSIAMFQHPSASPSRSDRDRGDNDEKQNETPPFAEVLAFQCNDGLPLYYRPELFFHPLCTDSYLESFIRHHISPLVAPVLKVNNALFIDKPSTDFREICQWLKGEITPPQFTEPSRVYATAKEWALSSLVSALEGNIGIRIGDENYILRKYFALGNTLPWWVPAKVTEVKVLKGKKNQSPLVSLKLQHILPVTPEMPEWDAHNTDLTKSPSDLIELFKSARDAPLKTPELEDLMAKVGGLLPPGTLEQLSPEGHLSIEGQNYLIIKDTHGNWLPAKVIAIDSDANGTPLRLKVTYVGWNHTWDEWIATNNQERLKVTRSWDELLSSLKDCRSLRQKRGFDFNEEAVQLLERLESRIKKQAESKMQTSHAS